MGVKVVKEIVSGSSASLALSAAGGGSSNGLRFQRTWKIVFENPTDFLSADVRAFIGVTIGSPHPSNILCVCDSIDVKPDGESRHSYVITATYSSTALSMDPGGYDGQEADPRTQPPDTRKANWSTETSTIEVPSWHWKPQWPNLGGWQVARNPAGDLYDGVMTMQPIVNIRVEQLQARDPNQWALNVGYVNSNSFRIGALNCFPRSVMFRGVSATPHVEVVGSRGFRGWKANFEFVYKPGYNSYMNQYLGWDVATPVSGFNVVNLAGSQARNDVDKGALSLRLSNDTVGTIQGWPNPQIEPTLVGETTRANVLISAPNAKAMQRPTAQPVPLNFDGTPRSRNLDPIVQRCQVYMDFDMSKMELRLN